MRASGQEAMAGSPLGHELSARACQVIPGGVNSATRAIGPPYAFVRANAQHVWDADGRRYLAAYRNRPNITDPRELTTLERSVFRYASLGESNKEIAFTLGLSTGAVASAVSQIVRKLGCRRRSELVAFADPARATRVEVAAGDEEVSVLSLEHSARGRAADRLSAAERDVASRVVAGETNTIIARERGTSPNTVANQISQIFAKLDVGSRAELVRALNRD